MNRHFQRINKLLKTKLEQALRSKSSNLTNKTKYKNKVRQVMVELGLIDNLNLKISLKAILSYVERDQSLLK